MIISVRRCLLCSFLLLLSGYSFSSPLSNTAGEDALYKQGLQLYEKGQFSTARFRFREAIDAGGDVRSVLYGNAQFYEAMCAFELNNADAPELARVFLTDQRTHPGVVMIRLRLARYYFDKKDFERALEWLHLVAVPSVPTAERDRYYFQLGYALFSLNQSEPAAVAFKEVDKSHAVFGAPALYYYSHILYTQKQYAAALEGFVKLRDQVAYRGLAASYIVQIWFLQEKFREVADKGPEMLQGVPSEKRPEFLRVMGESFFRLEEYRQALNYLSGSMDGREPLAEEHYRLGFCLYKLERYDEAVPQFEKAVGSGGVLAQNASFHLADCYLKLGQKDKAREAFAASGAASAGTEPGGAASVQAEEALFHEAVLNYELKDKPVDQIIGRFTAFIARFTSSANVAEANGYLALLYLEMRNYRLALESLQKVPVLSTKLREAYQRVAYLRAIELMDEKQYDRALVLLDKSLEFAAADASVALRCYFVKGDVYYRMGQIAPSIAMYRRFLTSDGASVLEEYPAALYGLGYVYFDDKNFAEARNWFTRYIALRKEARDQKVSDALCRVGDTYYMQLQYSLATEAYRKVAAMNMGHADYALFQTGFVQGLLNDHRAKIVTLTSLLQRFATSSYADNAWYEIGRSHISLGEREQAIAAFRKVVDGYAQSDFKGRALLQLGLVYYNMDDLESSLSYYSKVVREFPGTDDARNALTGIRTIYVDRNTPEAYFEYVSSLGSMGMVRKGEQDSLMFKVAENLYIKNLCAESSVRLRAYLNSYPSGSFGLQAHYYLADCLSKSEQWEEALSHYADVLKYGPSFYRGPSLKASAAIAFRLKQYAESLAFYKTLTEESTEVAATDAARMGMARSYYELGDYAEALKLFTGLAREVQTADGAEAKFRVVDILFRQEKLSEAEKEVFNFGEKKSPQLFWMAKSYLVLSDIYMARKDSFMAKKTLQSLIDNYGVSGDGILDSAREKMSVIQ